MCSGIFEAPVSAVRTLANVSFGKFGICSNAIQSGGAPGMSVTLRSRIVSTAVIGSKRSTSTTAEPRISEYASTTFNPKMWKRGSTPYTRSVPSILRTSEIWSRLLRRFPCDSIAAFGEPAVPLVNSITAR